jgi:ABC-2 type transport system ATP-binding protein
MNPSKPIHMRGVCKAFRYFSLQDLDLDLEPGQVMGLVGPNGAGKSTTLRLIMGLMAADRGQVSVLGHPMPQDQARAKREMGYVSAHMRLLPNASLAWHMDLMASIYPAWDARYAADLLDHFNLHPQQLARTLSLGEQTKAGLLLALARRPRLLILDEPTTGLDPVARQEVLSQLMEVMRDEERAILFSSHNTADVERICDRISFIDRGRLVASDDTHAFLERWRRIELQLEPGQALPELPGQVAHVGDGSFHTLTTQAFTADLPDRLGTCVRGVQRMNLEEIFVASVMHHREGRRA